MENKVYVVGVGADGVLSLTPHAREVVAGAELLVGTSRLLATIPEGGAERWAVNPGKAEVLARIEAALGERRVVVLASGDPGFFGIGKVLTRRLGKERVEIVPHLSSVQLAFARIEESWEDATFLSVHGRSLEGIGLKVTTVGDVCDQNPLINGDVGHLQEIGVDGDAAFVVRIGLSHRRPVQLAAQHGARQEAGPPSSWSDIGCRAGPASCPRVEVSVRHAAARGRAVVPPRVRATGQKERQGRREPVAEAGQPRRDSKAHPSPSRPGWRRRPSVRGSTASRGSGRPLPDVGAV